MVGWSAKADQPAQWKAAGSHVEHASKSHASHIAVSRRKGLPSVRFEGVFAERALWGDGEPSVAR